MKAWSAITALVIAIVAVTNVVAVLRRTPTLPRHPAFRADVVLRHEQRLGGVRAALARHGARGVIGYVTDLSPEKLTANEAAMQEYFLTQFVLSPWVLEAKFEGCAWAMANFGASPSPHPVPIGFRVVEDFGRGVLLLQKLPP
jgi:hypothetical protein